MSALDAVILEAGSGIVAVGVAEALAAARRTYAVVTMDRHSLLAGAPGAVAFERLSGRTVDERAAKLEELFRRYEPRDGVIAAFATEDGGLRMLHAFRARWPAHVDFARARTLALGGLDKVELFEALAADPRAARWIPPFLTVRSPEDVEEALARFGDDTVFKPGLKPFDMRMGGMEAKVISAHDGESREKVRQRACAALPLAERWLAQPRLRSFEDGERGVWAVRSGDGLETIDFVEHWKYPRMGGSGCWVSVHPGQSAFAEAAADVLRAIDFRGLAELPFLVDGNGAPRLLELNGRAWLQVTLAEAGGLRAIAGSLDSLAGRPLARTSRRAAEWINLERALPAIVTGAVPRWSGTRSLLGALRRRPHLAMWSSRLPGLRRRWAMRLLRGALA